MLQRMTRRGWLRGLALGGLLTLPESVSAGSQLLVIVHLKSPIDNLAADAVKSHFLREHKEWPDGSKVRPTRQEGDLHAVFLDKILHMSSIEYERYWLERKYSAAEAPPKTVDDDEGVIKFVGAMPGSIGYVDAASLDEKARAKVKVVLGVNY